MDGVASHRKIAMANKKSPNTTNTGMIKKKLPWEGFVGQKKKKARKNVFPCMVT